MDQLEQEYQISLYETLVELNHSPKSDVLLVQNSLTSKIYIKKILKNYNLDVYRKLQHIKNRHLPKIEEIFECEDCLIVIEEFINGRTLQEYMNEPLNESFAIKCGIRLCEVLEVLHNQKPPIIHRDIKPSNVMISADGVLKLIDFDVSRVYQNNRQLDTHILGTKGYASPEQFGFEQTDARSDIYSIGVLLNVLTTGDMYQKNRSKIGRIIDKCTKLSPNDRYQNVHELKSDLSKLIHRPIELKESLIRQQVNLYLSCLDFLNILPNKEPKNLVLKEIRQIPGYRRGNLLFVIIATLWYLFLIFGGTQGTSIITWIENVSLVICLISMTLLNSNYKQLQQRLPGIKDNLLTGLMVYNFIIFMIWGLLNDFLKR
ncbi:serine/threonine-protein kinase [Turicibacter sanguinis]|uniref:serine/threonine-protein kinase n=1 Tax=Turicibacter sanguinis TaxID=154288 RepID=UPI0006C4938F|nr:serine/threonine-protein kinase [Turicibacter sanguinis]MDB8437917.1 serine/threonine-protein kinase [Turicibacter sanguinis]MTK69152.1 protein kinase [Turicibacter sanguinis]MTK79675.1 protein kinase [Turicibacter sanguinis]MTK82609.1 protein kinase [Turicibacter sanguinis]MTK85498.1 protein kinase [Turicibacter sanguinis]